MEDLAEDVTVNLCTDGTFSIVPKRLPQNKGKTVLVMSFILGRKTLTTYLQVFQFFSSKAPFFKVTEISCDFEENIGRDAINIYGQPTIQRCHFHYCQMVILLCLYIWIDLYINSSLMNHISPAASAAGKTTVHLEIYNMINK